MDLIEHIMHHLASLISSPRLTLLSFLQKANPLVKWSDVFLQLQLAHANTRANTKDGSA